MRLTQLALLLALATAFGCNPPVTATDAGGGGNDTGGSATDTGSGAADTGGGTGDVAACQAAVDGVIAACNAETSPPADRLCLYQAYRDLCAQGRTAVVTAMMNCLAMDACQSAADPSGATACVAGVVAANQNAAHMALGAAVCGCESSPETGCPTFPQYSGAELIMGTDADVMTVTSCIAAQSTCSDPDSCYEMIPFGHAFLQCFP